MENKNIVMAQSIARAVSEKGGRVYYVGGFVRDSICKKENKDIDIEVHGISPDGLEAVLETLGHPKVMGANFGIFGLAGYELDISMPRKCNTKGTGGKESISECADPFIGEENAARRRDFTVNAMMTDVLTGETLDFFNGREDLSKGIIRHVDSDTFAQDPLRVIRAAQFAARFGFTVAEETEELCRSIDISDIACERVFEELKKALLKSDKPSIFFEVLRKQGKLDKWFPEVKALIDVMQPPQFHPEGDVWNHTMNVIDIGAQLSQKSEYPLGFMLSLLCHDFGKPSTTTFENGRIRSIGHDIEGVGICKTFIKRLTSDNHLRCYVENMTELHMRPNMIADQGAGSKAFCRLFDASVSPKDLLLVSEADFRGCATNEPYDDKRDFLYGMLDLFNKRMAKPFVSGEDLIKAGAKPGKALGEALKYAHKLRLSGVHKKEALCQTLAFLKRVEDGEK